MSDLPVGSIFAGYRIERLLGVGGMGSVYLARHPSLPRSEAIKVLSVELSRDPAFRSRFVREADIAASLDHPNIVSVHQRGEFDGKLWIAMQYVQGTDADAVVQAGAMDPARAVHIITEVGKALDYAHPRGVVHRDIKPANFLISPSGGGDERVLLADFGIARARGDAGLTATGVVVATLAYVAPEVLAGSQSDGRSDLYSLGGALYHLLTGKSPYFHADGSAAVMAAHLNQPPPSATRVAPWLPPHIDLVIARAMAKDPAQRFASARELAEAAAHALFGNRMAPHQPTRQPSPPTAPWSTSPALSHHHPQPAPPTVVPWAAHRRRSRRWPLAIGAVVLLIVVATGIAAVWLSGAGGDDGQARSNTTTHPAVDLSTLDIGSYDVTPRSFPGPPTLDEGRNIEAFTLAQWIVTPPDVDPSLIYINGLPVVTPAEAATGVSATGTPVVQPVLEKYGMISGFLLQGGQRSSDDRTNPKNGFVQIMLTSFPGPEQARRAAAEMDATDFAVNPANVHLDIPGYPDAHAHWTPGIPDVAATMASRSLVVSIYFLAEDLHATAADLAAQLQKILDAQLPLMDRADPSAEAALTLAPIDPDHMLSRVLIKGDPPPVGPNFVRVGGNAVIVCEGPTYIQQNLYGTADVDRCAGSHDGSVVVRAGAEAAAKELATGMVEADAKDIDHKITAPQGVPDAVCYEQNQDQWKDNHDVRFVCVVASGRYVASVYSGEEKDVLRRAAAQYALLVNNE